MLWYDLDLTFGLAVVTLNLKILSGLYLGICEVYELILGGDIGYRCRLDRVFCPKICLFKTDGWHLGTEFLITQKTSISENYCHFKLQNIRLNVLTV